MNLKELKEKLEEMEKMFGGDLRICIGHRMFSLESATVDSEGQTRVVILRVEWT